MKGMAKRREDAEASKVDLRAVVAAGHAALKAHAAKIDALNIYPVPDGDTGTNMLLTLQSVLDEVSASPDLKGAEAAKVVSRAALMGARGNSGVILSQILRGACEILGDTRPLDAETLAQAFVRAQERAYAAVRSPAEGTMLSVIKDASAAARACVERGERDPLEILGVATLEAHASVKRTPELLGILKEAGVVDAGGLGVAVILDGLLASLSDSEPVQGLEEAEPAAGGDRLRKTVAHSVQEAWGYCTEFLVGGFSGDDQEFRRCIHEIGKSVLVIPDGDLIKVHLHTHDPGRALTYAGTFGRLSGVKVEDMEEQTRARAASGNLATSSTHETAANLGVVAVSKGTGNRELFKSMGAVVVEGGQGSNPSTEDLVQAVQYSGASTVILLPNNKNILPTAERVGELIEAEVSVLPTTNIACGLAAMVGFDPAGEPIEVFKEMREICVSSRCAEITIAVRDSLVEGREVRKGAYIGLLDGKLHAVENSLHTAALILGRALIDTGADVITLLRGLDLGEAAAEEIAEGIRDMDEGLTVEVVYGGQPLYPLQMVAE
jgi:DAK2 domain fusion protein YloV